MKIRTLLAATIPALVLVLAPAVEAAASGACVYVTMIRGKKSLQCADGVANKDLCNRKAVTGEGDFRPGEKCKDLDYAFHPGPGPIPPPPAKPSADTKRPHMDERLLKGRRDDR